MPDFRPILHIVGILLATLGLTMLVPMIADLAVGNPDWQVFLASALATLFVGLNLYLITRGRVEGLNIQQAFLMTTASWLALAMFAALPLAFAELDLDYTDAFFEAMSGLTTTGSTVIVGLDNAPPGILLWRSLLQWLGGIGIIVMALSVLPMLQVGGMQLFRTESSDTSEKILPRAAQIAGAIGLVYLGVSTICALSYWAAGMKPFDAVAHSMTTIATGGFSTSDASVGKFSNGLIDTVAVVFMVVGSLPFVLYLQAIRGNPLALWRDSQVRAFVGIVVVAVGGMFIYQAVAGLNDGTLALRYAAFNVISVMTGTGYATTTYDDWGDFAVAWFFFIMFIGGCAGSTSCGIKIFRFQVLYETAIVQVRRVLQPHGVFVAHYNGRPIPETVAASVMSFFFLFVVCFGAIALLLSALGLDYLTAISGAATSIANVGPGLGDIIGPAGNFSALPDAAKWVLSFGMLVGRLELFTVLVLVLPSFWRA